MKKKTLSIQFVCICVVLYYYYYYINYNENENCYHVFELDIIIQTIVIIIMWIHEQNTLLRKEEEEKKITFIFSFESFRLWNHFFFWFFVPSTPFLSFFVPSSGSIDGFPITFTFFFFFLSQKTKTKKNLKYGSPPLFGLSNIFNKIVDPFFSFFFFLKFSTIFQLSSLVVVVVVNC